MPVPYYYYWTRQGPFRPLYIRRTGTAFSVRGRSVKEPNRDPLFRPNALTKNTGICSFFVYLCDGPYGNNSKIPAIE